MAKKRKARIDDRFAGRSQMHLMRSADPRDRIAGVGRLLHGEGNWIAPMAREMGIARQTLVDWLIVEDRRNNIWITIDETLLTVIMRAADAMKEELIAKTEVFSEAEKIIAARTTSKGRKS